MVTGAVIPEVSPDMLVIMVALVGIDGIDVNRAPASAPPDVVDTKPVGIEGNVGMKLRVEPPQVKFAAPKLATVLNTFIAGAFAPPGCGPAEKRICAGFTGNDWRVPVIAFGLPLYSNTIGS